MKGLIKFILLCLPLAICDNLQAQKDFSEEQVTKMLKEFYTAYITTFDRCLSQSSGPETLTTKIDSIVTKYSTPDSFSEFEGDVDYDPFLKSQMVDTLILKTISFKKDSIKNNLYYVTYTYGKDSVMIKLRVAKKDNCYKIDLVYKD